MKGKEFIIPIKITSELINDLYILVKQDHILKRGKRSSILFIR